MKSVVQADEALEGKVNFLIKVLKFTSELIDQKVYCPDVAERKYQEHLRAKGPDIKLGNDHAFASRVEDLIVNQGFSPAAALKTIEADDEE